MRQLRLGDILELAEVLKSQGMAEKEINALPVYLGDDDELNGIHCAWYRQLIDKDNEDDAALVELINENGHNNPLEGRGILIS